MQNSNLHTAINAVMQECKYIKNDTTISMGGSSSYKSISSEKVKEVIQPLLVKHGLTVSPVNIEPSTEVFTWEEGGRRKKEIIMNLIVTFQITHAASGEQILTQSMGTGIDNGDKAPGKALTYAEKNLFLNLFVIPTGEDKDDFSVEEPAAVQKIKIEPGTETWANCLRALKAGNTTLEAIAADERYELTSANMLKLGKELKANA